jgi:pimeloyl-ACP methyl ester carboxylesterase
MQIQHSYFDGAGVRLHAAHVGEGPPVLFLHGFPEFWISWRHQLPALAEAGFRAVALDMRGYNLSDRPSQRQDYALDLLVEDVAAVVRQLGGRAHVVAHDWGGIVAWAFAGRYPQLLDKLVIINAPHMGVYRKKVVRTSQIFRSWYIGLFCLPGHVAEKALSKDNYAWLKRIFEKGPLQKHAFSKAQIDEYTDVMRQPGALTAALNYYREGTSTIVAMDLAANAHVSASTLVLWGDQDPALGVELLDGLDAYVSKLRIQRFLNSSHWLQNELPEEVNRALIDFLK